MGCRWLPVPTFSLILLMAVCGGVTGLAAEGGGEVVRVKLRNGDQISGVVDRFDGDGVNVRSPLLGQIRLPLAAITEVVCRTEVAITLKNGQILHAHLRAVTPEVLQLSDGEAVFLLQRDAVDLIRSGSTQGASLADLSRRAEELETLSTFRPKRWSTGLDFGYTLNRSTTSSDDLFLRFRTQRDWKAHLFTVNGHIFHGVRDGVISKREFFAAFRHDYRLSSGFYLFHLTSGEYDPVERIDLRSTFSGGVGRPLLRRGGVTLSLDAGVGFLREKYDDGRTNDDGTLILTEQLAWSLNHRLQLAQSLSTIPYITGDRRYRVVFDLTLRSPLYRFLNLSFGVSNKYDSSPQAGVSRNDFKALSTLGITF